MTVTRLISSPMTDRYPRLLFSPSDPEIKVSAYSNKHIETRCDPASQTSLSFHTAHGLVTSGQETRAVQTVITSLTSRFRVRPAMWRTEGSQLPHLAWACPQPLLCAETRGRTLLGFGLLPVSWSTLSHRQQTARRASIGGLSSSCPEEWGPG